jgi:hypothetical protein
MMKKTIRLNQEAIAALKEQKKGFVAKFGREPGPGDPVFFDPSKDVPTPMSIEQQRQGQEEIAEAMKEAGIAPDFIYAYMKTGLMPTKQNLQFLSKAEKKEFNDACEEYHQLKRH